MARVKPILALSSIGLGIALVLVATSVQRDRFAFTAADGGKSAALTRVVLELPMPKAPLAVPDDGIPVVRVEELKVLPVNPPILKRQKPATLPESVEPVRPCNPSWRELESGPAGRKVREICEPPPDDVPRS
jgi:hypothetical protein